MVGVETLADHRGRRVKDQQRALAQVQATLATLTAEMAELKKRRKPHESERRKTGKMPPALEPQPDPSAAARKRAAADALRAAKMETEVTPVPVPPEQCVCPHCGNEKLRNVGKGKPSTVIEYVPGYFRRRVLLRQTLACRCGHIVTAPAPERVAEKTRYAPSFRQLDIEHRAYFWDFVTPELIVYCFAPSRSGETPKRVLGDSQGRLVVDQHTGYNAVTRPGQRTRAGCLAHARRKIFEQRELKEAQEALDLIGAIYGVEREAAEQAIVGTAAHLELRRHRSRPLFARLLCWGRRHRARFEPRSGMGRAIRYLLRHHGELGCFLRHATIPPDNNKAEAGLRRIALGRGAYLFVGHEESGHDHAVLFTLVASCEKHGVNPIEYLTDVLTRVQTHPASRVDELLPHRWKPP